MYIYFFLITPFYYFMRYGARGNFIRMYVHHYFVSRENFYLRYISKYFFYHIFVKTIQKRDKNMYIFFF